MKTKEKCAFNGLKNRYEDSKKEIALAAIFHSVYTEKISKETVHTKVINQLNSVRTSISRINPKFHEKSKNYDKMEEQLMATLNQYEANLTQFCKKCDAEIHACILEKVELESKLLMTVIEKENGDKKRAESKNKMVHSINTMVEKIKTKKNSGAKEKIDQSNEKGQEYQKRIETLKKQIKTLDTKINNLNAQKVTKLFDAMESGDKQISTQIKKPRTFHKITKFFMNRFNTYSAILKNVIEPLSQRIDQFERSELKNGKIEQEEFNLQKVEEKIANKQNEVLMQLDRKMQKEGIKRE